LRVAKTVGASLLAMPDGAVFQLNRVDAIAIRPAPTFVFALSLFHYL
jgi:hypothetical protein